MATEEALQEFVTCARYGEKAEMEAMLAGSASEEERVKLASGRTRGDQSALQNAAANGHTEVVEMLLEARAEVGSSNEAGNTALHWAALLGQMEAARLLVRAGGDVQAQNARGRTPLDEAFDAEHGDIFDFLSEAQEREGEEKKK